MILHEVVIFVFRYDSTRRVSSMNTSVSILRFNS